MSKQLVGAEIEQSELKRRTRLLNSMIWLLMGALGIFLVYVLALGLQSLTSGLISLVSALLVCSIGYWLARSGKFYAAVYLFLSSFVILLLVLVFLSRGTAFTVSGETGLGSGIVVIAIAVSFILACMSWLFGESINNAFSALRRRSEELQASHKELESANEELQAVNEQLEQDLTERKRMEEELKLRAQILDGATDSIFLHDFDGNFIHVNEMACKTHGYSKEEFMKMKLHQVIAPERVSHIASDFQQMLEKGQVIFESTHLRKDGSIMPVEVHGCTIESDGRKLLLTVIRDITERKKAEEKLTKQKELTDRILATTPNAVLVIDRDSRIILANKTFCQTFEMTPAEAQNRQVKDVIPVADLSEVISKALAGTEPQPQFEFRQKRDGDEGILVARVYPMGEGEILILISDVTDDRRRQERLLLTDRLASIGEMASGIAHELNNPLTSVIGLSQLLTEEDLPDDAKEDVEAIYSEAQRAAGVVRNLLTFARRHMPVRQLTQINRVLDDVLTLRAYVHRVNNIQVNTRFAPKLPEIMVDYFQMQQVFLNIVLNAEAAMIEAHNQGTLTIAIKRVNNNIKVSFTDDGPGIAEDNLSRLFDPFFTTKEVGKGTGLGLSICYGIVTGHGGKIYAQSELGKGATFVVELPVNVH